jgi:hypothetical protein
VKETTMIHEIARHAAFFGANRPRRRRLRLGRLLITWSAR